MLDSTVDNEVYSLLTIMYNLYIPHCLFVVEMNEWMNERMNEWMNDWMNEWIIEWMNEWVNRGQIL